MRWFKKKTVFVKAEPQSAPTTVTDVFYRWHYSAQDDPCPSCGAVWADHVLRHEVACVYNEWEEFGEIPCAICGEDVVDGKDNRHLHSGKVECDRP